MKLLRTVALGACLFVVTACVPAGLGVPPEWRDSDRITKTFLLRGFPGRVSFALQKGSDRFAYLWQDQLYVWSDDAELRVPGVYRDALDLTWPASSDQIYFVKADSSRPSSIAHPRSIYTAQIPSGELHPVLENIPGLGAYEVSRDTRRIAFLANGDVFLKKIEEDSPVIRMTEGEFNADIVMSEDGNRLIYRSGNGAPDQSIGVIALDKKSATERRTFQVKSQGLYSDTPFWLGNDRVVAVNSGKSNKFQMSVFDITSGEQAFHDIAIGDGKNNYRVDIFTPSHDSSKVAVQVSSGLTPEVVHIIDTQSGTIDKTIPYCEVISWLSDQKKLLCTYRIANARELFILDVE